jgi:hypothetical protein
MQIMLYQRKVGDQYFFLILILNSEIILVKYRRIYFIPSPHLPSSESSRKLDL